MSFVANGLDNTKVKDVWKSANICQSYERMYSNRFLRHSILIAGKGKDVEGSTKLSLFTCIAIYAPRIPSHLPPALCRWNRQSVTGVLSTRRWKVLRTFYHVSNNKPNNHLGLQLNGLPKYRNKRGKVNFHFSSAFIAISLSQVIALSSAECRRPSPSSVNELYNVVDDSHLREAEKLSRSADSHLSFHVSRFVSSFPRTLGSQFQRARATGDQRIHRRSQGVRGCRCTSRSRIPNNFAQFWGLRSCYCRHYA